MKYFIFMGLIFLMISCSNGNSTSNVYIAYGNKTEGVIDTVNIDSIEGAYLSLSMKKYDFGKIKRESSPSIAIEFEVENIGKTPLVIIKCDVFCGCLSVDYPKDPIMSHCKAKLAVHIDTRNQEGKFNKSVFIKSNADNDISILRIVGEVQN